MDKCQVCSFTTHTFSAEQPIHQQESDRLQGSGSPYNTSRTTITVFLQFLPMSPSVISNSHQCITPSSFHPDIAVSTPNPASSLYLSGRLLFFPPQAPSLFPLLLPTGWAVKQEQAHGKPLTTRNSAIELYSREDNY